MRGEEEGRKEHFFPSHLSEPFLFPSMHQAGLLHSSPSSILPGLGNEVRRLPPSPRNCPKINSAGLEGVRRSDGETEAAVRESFPEETGRQAVGLSPST